MERRDFIKKIAVAGAISTIPDFLMANPNSFAHKEKIWSSLLHLSFNMWEDHDRWLSVPDANPNMIARVFDPNLRLSEPLWNDALNKMVAMGLNMVIIDLGDGVIYDSHPEIAVKNAWTKSKLRNELARVRKMGLEPIPKLNFSTGHDAWLKEYERMVSTEKYYQVCKELIAETMELFDKPRFFHIGYDEETAQNQRHYDYAIIRQHNQYWKDFNFFVNEVEKGGARAWIWSDMAWHNPNTFFKNMPKTVIQSNWYYENNFQDLNNKFVKAYLRLEAEGYDQIPAFGYYEIEKGRYADRNSINTVQFAEKNFTDAKVLGYMHTSWRPTMEVYRKDILTGLNLTGEAKQWYLQNRK
ncbi:MAG TPA: hypothetical protein VNI52_14605 [Sphingobacteriaceae bacterium]|nr:hypothetical protein [Sphingobacteriaceae bacterium]